MKGLLQISVSGEVDGEYVVLSRGAHGRLTIAPVPLTGLPVITSMRKTCTACPSQWEGTLDDHRAIYARYRWGELSVGLGERIEDAVRKSGSDEALLREYVGDGFDGFMDFEELRTHLHGLLEFPADLTVENEREPFPSPQSRSHPCLSREHGT